MEKLVLFVCTGNTCRSPMAEAYFRKCASERGLAGFCARSAGLCAVPGAGASAGAKAVMAELGIELKGFRSTVLTAQLLEEAFLVVTMSDSHLRRIAGAVPEAAAKCRLLMDYAGGGQVGDPFGGSDAEYRECFEGMRPAIENLIETLKKETY